MRFHPPRSAGYALLIVLTFMGASLLILAGAINWAAQGARSNERSNEYQTAVAAAEGATEKILALIARDNQAGGEPYVNSQLKTYEKSGPVAAENPLWKDFSFSDGHGQKDRIFIDRLSNSSFVALDSQYKGLSGFAATYRIVAHAHDTSSPNNVAAGVGQDVQLAAIPIFQFALYYSIDMEINPGPVMVIQGRVHGNSDVFVQPGSRLEFLGDVTAAGKIILDRKPGDPLDRSDGIVLFDGQHDSGKSSLNLPIGTNNSPNAVNEVLQPPPPGESATSVMGQQRYYNKADLVILVSNTTVFARSGYDVDRFKTKIPQSDLDAFLSTNVTFFDKRENKTISTTQIDVGKLTAWSQTNTTLRSKLGRDLNQIYVADFRTQSVDSEPGIRVVNGQSLPPLGLTVATPQPLYVQGNYNCPAAALGTSDTLWSKPASLVGDSINVLSSAWSDANSGSPLALRPAADTTVNAAFLGGICVTTNGNYSGGVENFPRFLEDWTSHIFTYNGSMVVMFDSRVARAPWGGPDVYVPPTRHWSFDSNFTTSTRLPPGTPQLVTIIRSRWATVTPGTSTF